MLSSQELCSPCLASSPHEDFQCCVHILAPLCHPMPVQYMQAYSKGEGLQVISNHYQESAGTHPEQDECRFLIKAGIILFDLVQAIFQCIVIPRECRLFVFGFPGCLEVFNCRKGSPKCWLCLRREVLLDAVWVLLVCQFNVNNWETAITHCKDLRCFLCPFPISLSNAKCRPWNMIANLTIVLDSCDWAKTLIGSCYEEANWLWFGID